MAEHEATRKVSPRRSEFEEAEADARRTWDAAVEAVPRDMVDRRVLPQQRSVKDLVAHIAAWERWGAERLRATIAGRPLEPTGEWEPYEHAFNARAYARWWDASWATVRTEALDAYRAFWTAEWQLSDEQLFGPGGRERMIVACGSEHYAPYVAQIRDALESLPPLTTIETARLRLRSFRPSDAPALFEVFGDPEVRRYLPPGPAPTLERIRRAVDRRVGHERAHGFGLWAVERRDTGELIGDCGPLLVDWTGPEIEIAYHYRRSAWGQGLGTEAAVAALARCFGPLGLERVIAICFPENTASWRVMEKAGMRHEGEAEYYGIRMKKYAAEGATWASR